MFFAFRWFELSCSVLEDGSWRTRGCYRNGNIYFHMDYEEHPETEGSEQEDIRVANRATETEVLALFTEE